MNREFKMDIEDDFKSGIYLANKYRAHDFPPVEVPENIIQEELPLFMKKIARNGALSDDGWEVFIQKFMMIYLTSERIRKHTDGWIFLFVDGSYGGAFESRDDAVDYGKSIGNNVFLHPMYPMVIGEYPDSEK
jgi:hypothetical protein